MIRIFLFLFSSMMLSFTISGQKILGTDKACMNSCTTYTIEDGFGGPYYWSSEGGTLSTNHGDTIKICWTEIGIKSVQVVDLSASGSAQELQVNVQVYADVDPEIVVPPYPNCNPIDSSGGSTGQDLKILTCTNVCPGSTLSYFTKYKAGNSYQWEVIGGDIINTSNSNVDVKWQTGGPASIKVIEWNEAGCIDSSEYCITFLPQINTTIQDLQGNTNATTVCLGQSVYLSANSSETQQFEWISPGGKSQSGTTAEFSFNQSGSHIITLIGKSHCLCPDTNYFEILVDPLKGPDIACTGTICSGEEETYYAIDICDKYYWQISPEGTILEGGGQQDDYIKVLWNSGSKGVISLSTEGCTPVVCDKPTEIVVPIIESTLNIEGKAISCKTEKQYYSAPFFNGINYNWNITGNGSIIGGLGSNQILVEWSEFGWDPDTALISLEYDNCFLGCGGYSEFQVNLKPAFELSGEFNICENVPTYFQTLAGWDGVIADWSVYNQEGILVESFNNTASVAITFSNGPGTYYISAENNSTNYCNDFVEGIVEVYAQPDPVPAIEGPLTICKNVSYQYEANLISSGHQLRWEVKDGNDTKIYTADKVLVEWKSNGPYSVKVSVIDKLHYCTSEPTEIKPQLIDNVGISANTTACVDNISIYSLDVSNSTEILWEISPSTAGSILFNSQGEAEIMWHTPGTHEIKATYCSKTLSLNVEVKPHTIIGDFDMGICEGTLANINLPNIPGQFETFDENGSLVSDQLTFTTGAGYYIIEHTNPEGCITKEFFHIIEYPKPTINISTPEETGFCPPHPAVTIYALNTGEGLSYQWYKDNIPFGGNSSTLSSNEFGTYKVEVTDINGCSAISNTLTLFEWCQGGGFCTGGTCNLSNCDSDGNVSFTSAVDIYCNEYQFKNTSVGAISGTYKYFFDDPLIGLDNTSSLENPTHSFTKAGFYVVIMIGNVISNTPPPFYCEDWDYDIITVPVAADFDYEKSCPGEGMIFRDLSSFIPGRSIASWEWDFGDPASGFLNKSTDANPLHIYSQSGEYDVSLIITADSGCKAKIIQKVQVLESPETSIIMPYARCVDMALKFKASPFDPLFQYQWNFGDLSNPGSNISSALEALHTFTASGTYAVELITKNIYNCQTSEVQNIEVAVNNFSGDISANKAIPICYGEKVTLNAPSGGLAYFWSNGQTGPQIDVSEPGSYSVTITTPDACDYFPDPFQVNVLTAPSIEITGYTYEENEFQGTPHANSLEVCEGEIFDFRCNYIFGATYLWNIGTTTYYLQYNEVSNLGPGTHLLDVLVDDPSTGCKFLSDEFKVVIHPKPQNVVIESDATNYCEGSEITFKIKNPNSSLRYYWNDGTEGTEITTGSPGNYYALALNEYGCETQSNVLSIFPKPDVSKLTHGCIPVCFPDTICLPQMNDIVSFQWLKDGIAVSNDKNLEVFDLGDYELILENIYGCIDTSYILSLELKEGNKSADGIVFLDQNANSIYDSGDQLLEGINVILSDFSGVIGNTSTNAAGYYHFDQIGSGDITVEIDTIGTSLNLSAAILDKSWSFTKCIEDTNLDFPLLKSCESAVYQIVLQTCYDNSIDYQGQQMWAGEEDEFTFTDVNGCDSIVHVVVEAFEKPQYSIENELTCLGKDMGIIEIFNEGIGQLMYSLDGTKYSSNAFFQDLSAGHYTLYIEDENKCLYQESVEIAETPGLAANFPEVNITCSTGQVTLWADIEEHYGEVSYAWSTGETAPIIAVYETGLYAVTLSDDCERISHSWNLDFSITKNDQGQISMPNIFTPNGDGINDIFKPFDGQLSGIENYTLEVFDRWGNRVYQSKSPEEGWNGIYKSALSAPAVFVYQLKFESSFCGKKETITKFGDVTLVK